MLVYPRETVVLILKRSERLLRLAREAGLRDLTASLQHTVDEARTLLAVGGADRSDGHAKIIPFPATKP
jgi:hypothetical protein